ncbi:cytochrome c [uncultured Sunxiuqinia sp.]|uniref:c-type cytochrome n=1 Tax=uncultured Sunxiuqinia sp. TaxID=1573825 RepID=UPI002AA8267B|nr:cytochrome c [uncultured Sunxiuqinia sp.]
MNLKNGIKLLVILIVAIAFSSCDHNRNNPGWQYFDDMVKSPAYESYTPNPNFEDGKTMQGTIEGTIPRDMIPYPYGKTDSDRAVAGQTLQNPLTAIPETIARGKELYGIYCLQCHGENGDGKGPLYTSKKYPYPPASLISEKMLAAPEGEIYHVITVGWGVMGEHGSMLLPKDRWKITSYIENELQKN